MWKYSVWLKLRFLLREVMTNSMFHAHDGFGVLSVTDLIIT